MNRRTFFMLPIVAAYPEEYSPPLFSWEDVPKPQEPPKPTRNEMVQAWNTFALYHNRMHDEALHLYDKLDVTINKSTEIISADAYLHIHRISQLWKPTKKAWKKFKKLFD